MTRADEIAQTVAATLEGARITKGRVDATERLVEGRRAGMHVEVRCWYNNDLSGWVVETKGASPPLLMSVDRRALGDGAAIARGAVLVVSTGDEAFDREWTVEGAPATTVREVLDESTRRAIVATGRGGLAVDGGTVTAGDDGNRYTADEVVLSIDAAVAVRARLSALAPLARADAEGSRAAEAEIARLRELRERTWARLSWPARITVVIAGCLLAAAVVAGVYYGCLPSR